MRAVLAVAALVLPVTLVVAGCSGSATDSVAPSAVSSGGSEMSEPALDGGGADRAAAGSSEGQAQGAKAVSPVVGPKLVRTATVSLVVGDVTKAAASVRAVAASVDGVVTNESLGSGQPMPVEDPTVTRPSDTAGMLVLSVPAASLDRTLAALAKVGTVSSRTTNSSDVTAEYVDTESRLATMRASVERVRKLMAEATSIGQVVTLESELSRREADLESLEAQLASLKGNVERSTVTVYLGTSAEPVEEPNPFLAGLASGWDAFLGSAKALLTVVGAVLPFALFGTLLGVPLVLWIRRRVATGAPVVPQVSPSPGPDAPAAP